MTWTKNLSRTPTWPDIVLRLLVGLMFLALAVLDATRYADQVATHGDGLMTVGLAAVGGLTIGTAIGSIRHRAAMRQVAGVSPATSA